MDPIDQLVRYLLGCGYPPSVWLGECPPPTQALLQRWWDARQNPVELAELTGLVTEPIARLRLALPFVRRALTWVRQGDQLHQVCAVMESVSEGAVSVEALHTAVDFEPDRLTPNEGLRKRTLTYHLFARVLKSAGATVDVPKALSWTVGSTVAALASCEVGRQSRVQERAEEKVLAMVRTHFQCPALEQLLATAHEQAEDNPA